MTSVAIGLPMYNGEEHLAEALESLLSQTFADFLLVLVDDASTDASVEIAGRYAEDPRLLLVTNKTRRGLVANWRHAYSQAKAACPDLEMFAWASDHDIWHPRWLERLVAELDADPGAVAAFPRFARIGDGGRAQRWETPLADTRGMTDPWERAELIWHAGGFGARAYGLFRARALERCGVLRTVYAPDRLLLVELALHGTFREVREVLWTSRVTGIPSRERQRAAFFPDGREPRRLRGSWFEPHVRALRWSLGIRGLGRPAISRRRGREFARRYRELCRVLDLKQRGR